MILIQESIKHYVHGTVNMFIRSLSIKDLNRLRHIVRNTHLKFYPTIALTNREVDNFINSLGPDVAGKMIKFAVDNKHID